MTSDWQWLITFLNWLKQLNGVKNWLITLNSWKKQTDNASSSHIRTWIFSNHHCPSNEVLLHWMSIGTQAHLRFQMELIYRIHHKNWWKNGWHLVLHQEVPNSSCHILSLQKSDQSSLSSLNRLQSFTWPCGYPSPFSTDEILQGYCYSIVISMTNIHTSCIS